MRTISSNAAYRRILGVPVLTGLLAAPLQVSSPAIKVTATMLLLILLAWNCIIVERRRVFTEAAEKLRPIEDANDPTLFPDEIDPYQAKPNWLTIIGAFQVQIAIAVVTFLGTVSLLQFVGMAT